MMPASRATSSTSPLASCRSRINCSVAGAMRTRPEARANRNVTALPLTSTMRLAPWSSKWDKPLTRLNLRLQLQRAEEFSRFSHASPGEDAF